MALNDSEIIRMREEGASWFDIKDAGCPMTKAQRLVKQRAPHSYPSTLRVKYAWKVGRAYEAGDKPSQISERHSISISTVYHALNIYAEIIKRRHPNDPTTRERVMKISKYVG